MELKRSDEAESIIKKAIELKPDSSEQILRGHAPHFQKYLIENEIERRYEGKSYHIVTMDPKIKECCLPRLFLEIFIFCFKNWVAKIQ